MAVAFMHIIRLAAFGMYSPHLMHVSLHVLSDAGVVLLFSLITLGLSADITHTTESDSQFYFKFAAMGIAVSLLTMLTLPVL
jgi:hypothetical protein